MASRAESVYQRIRELDPAGRTAYVEGWVDAEVRELEYLDFKRVGGESVDQKTWSQALSGFANTEGGVLAWGIGTGKVKPPDGDRKIDVATELKPLPNTASFVQFLRDHLMDSTIEPVRGVEYLEVAATDGGGYVVCLIPEGQNKPYRDARTHQYWQRIADNFVPIPHTLLRSLFFPRFHPSFKVAIYWIGTYLLSIDIINTGRGSADGVYLSLRYKNEGWKVHATPPCREVINRGVLRDGDDQWRLYGVECTVSVHPQQQVACVSINLQAVKNQKDFDPLAVVIHSRDSEPVNYFVTKDRPIQWDSTEPLILEPSIITVFTG
jgi:hypothetical protein